MISRDWTHSWVTKGGIKVTARIGPYVWIYKQGKIDAIIVSDEKGCEVRPTTPKHFNMATTTEEELNRFAEQAEMLESDCRICGYHMLNRKSEYHSSDECKECCKKLIIAEYNAENQKRLVEEAQHEREMYLKGFRWKVVAWIHAGEDDEAYTIFYSEKPSIRVIQSFLKAKSSKVMNDYSIVELSVTN